MGHTLGISITSHLLLNSTNGGTVLTCADFAHFQSGEKIICLFLLEMHKKLKVNLSHEKMLNAKVVWFAFSFHTLSTEHFSLKIDVHDQTIWKCIQELWLFHPIQMKLKLVGLFFQKSTRWC